MLDHEEASRLVRGATFAMAMPNYDTRQNPPAKVGCATPALYYADALEGTDPLGQRVYPHFYVDISKQLPNKREMLARHTSQREWLRSYHGLDEYLDRMTAWAAGFGRECGFAYAEGFRQHLGHAYPRAPLLQNALAQSVHVRDG
jgi:LmbE family N-acetylglucosaminyl deacetylase